MLQDVNAAWETIRTGGNLHPDHGFAPSPFPDKNSTPPAQSNSSHIPEEETRQRAFSALAIISFVVTLLGLLLVITGIGPFLLAGAIVLAHAGRSSVRKHGYRGRWMATFSLWTGYLAWIGILTLLAYVWGTNFHKRVVADYQTSHPTVPQVNHSGGADANTARQASSETMATDNAEAAAYRLKAIAGDATAERNLGLLYYSGKGVPKNFGEALKWAQLAAAKGDPISQELMGTIFHNGLGVPKDYSQALSWYQKAADQGAADAQYACGIMYQNGESVPQDENQAFNWFEKAAIQGKPEAQFNVGLMYRDGSGTAKDYNEALNWFQKAANQDDVKAQVCLGLMYQHGLGESRDYGQALSWFQKAAAQSNADAECDIGVMYCFGQGVAQDYGRALSWWQKAANGGNIVAEINMGVSCEKGEGMKKDIPAAVEWYRKAAAQDRDTASQNEALKSLSRLGY
jgi:TPR repeat protein